MDPFMIASLGMQGLGMLGGLLSIGSSPDQIDVDPSLGEIDPYSLAKGKEFFDPRSAYYRDMEQTYSRIAGRSAPTLDSMLQLAAAQNVSPSIAFARFRSQQPQLSETVLDAMDNAVARGRQTGMGLLGMHLDSRKFSKDLEFRTKAANAGLKSDYRDRLSSFADQGMILGQSLMNFSPDFQRLLGGGSGLGGPGSHLRSKNQITGEVEMELRRQGLF